MTESAVAYSARRTITGLGQSPESIAVLRSDRSTFVLDWDEIPLEVLLIFFFVWPKRRRRRNPVIGSFLVGFPAAVAIVNLFDCSSYRMLFITSQWESSHRNSVPSTPRYISISNNCNKDLVALFSFSECSVRIFDFMGGSSHQSWRIIRAGSVWAPLVV